MARAAPSSLDGATRDVSLLSAAGRFNPSLSTGLETDELDSGC